MFVMMVMKKERWLEWWEEGRYIDNSFFLEPGFLPVPLRRKSRSSHVHMERGVVACAERTIKDVIQAR